MPYKLILLFTTLLFSCEQKLPTISAYIPINCNISGYSFQLGQTQHEVKKIWTLMEKENVMTCEEIEIYTLTYEEHYMCFYFYHDRLIRLDLSIPRKEAEENPIQIAGETIPIDLAIKEKDEITNHGYDLSYKCFDFDGMKEVSFQIGYSGAKELLKECNANSMTAL